MTCNVVKVARAPVMVCLQCPLCCNLVYEATTISECLHTFCRDCIYQRLGDGETDCCPICNVSLGCSPLEKLRADHQLDDIRAKIFPSKSMKRKVLDSSADMPVPPPARRKERSLFSLGVGAAPASASAGFANRKAKPLWRRSVTIRDTSADEFEDGKLDGISVELKDFEADEYLSETENSLGDVPETDIWDGKVVTISGEKLENPAIVKREIVTDGKRYIDGEEFSHGRKGEQFPSVKRTPLPKKISQELPLRSNSPNPDDLWSNLGMYLAERSKKSASGLIRSQSLDVTEHTNKLSCKQEDVDSHIGSNLKPPLGMLERREISSKNSKIRSSLAHLAEVAVDHAGAVGSLQKHTGQRTASAARSRRERGKKHIVKGASGGSLNLRIADERMQASTSQFHSRLPPLGRTSTGLNKLPVVRNKSSSANGGKLANVVSVSKRDRSQVGLWFALKSAENQMGDSALPQISTCYLRIKDGKLPVSVVKKYLVKKLDLKSESEVEITCRGQPVVPSLPLESVQGIWFATTPSDLFPSLKETNNAGKRWAPVSGSSAEDYMMVLTYGRNRRAILSP